MGDQSTFSGWRERQIDWLVELTTGPTPDQGPAYMQINLRMLVQAVLDYSRAGLADDDPMPPGVGDLQYAVDIPES